MARNDRPVIAVVCGGPSAEAEVSRSSGRCVAEALRATYRQVLLLELDPTVGERLHEEEVEVVFPVLHGPPGEDGTFQGFLEILGIRYVGSGVRASACGMDKVLSKRLFVERGLDVPRDVVVHRGEGSEAGARRALETIGPEVVVKPSSQGSAVGVLFASGAAGLEAAVAKAFEYDDRALVEERVEGAEITAAVLEREEVEVLPIVEVRTPTGTWYDYEHRYTEGLSEHVIPAPLSPAHYRGCEEAARQAHDVLGCRDLSRADFVVAEERGPVLLEVNTMPGMTPTSLYPDAARAAGISFEELVAHFVERAARRDP
jgi:D-alanine-D-alanine ligase